MTHERTQNARILRHLKRGRTITAMQAMQRWGIMRLASRIYDLKQEGHDIKMEMVAAKRERRFWRSNESTGTRYARYSLCDH